jgi:predicted alpha-1,2-mannosidase
MKSASCWCLVLGAFLLACGSGGGGAADVAPESLPEVVETASEAAEAGEVLPEASDAAGEEVAPQERLIDLVDPLIGTDFYGAAFGASFPGATRPFGMVKLGPETSSPNGRVPILHAVGYAYDDAYVNGFSHAHLQGIGVADYGQVMLMPTVGMDEAKIVERNSRAQFSHADEVARPGYYAVKLATGVQVELTATERAGMHRYTFKPGQAAVVLLDLGHMSGDGKSLEGHLVLDPSNRLMEGWMAAAGGLSGRVNGGVKTYVSVTFDRPVKASGTWVGDAFQPGSAQADLVDVNGARVGGWFEFDLGESPAVHARVGISFVDVAGARANARAEVEGRDFDALREEAQQSWEQALGQVQVTGGTPDQRTIFYTGLYHALFLPTLFTDVDGRYTGIDQQVHQAGEYVYYTDFSLWDTYRTEHPLLTLLLPQRQRDMAQSLVRMYEQGGFVPIWPIGTGESSCMVGESGDVVIADTVIKGITGFDVAKAYEGLVSSAILPEDGGKTVHPRGCLRSYVELGYCAADAEDSSVSKTMEYAYDDFALARLAEHLGRADDVALFDGRAQGYKLLWHPESAFFRGRNADGSWDQPFDQFKWLDWYTEGDAWHYRFFAPWDADGLATLMGGADTLTTYLVEFFEGALAEHGTLMPGKFYWHGNEPDIHSPWLFADAGRPDLAQRWVRWVMDVKYTAQPDGLNGNDDCGTLSSWYVFSALGLYPVPARDYYLLGAPAFTSASLALAGGTLTVRAEGASPENLYVQSATWNGAPLAEPRLKHAQLAAGGELVFDLGPQPSAWARAEGGGR